MIVKDDVPAVFRQAIAEGRLSNNSPTNNAALYMYMYTSDDGVDQFKHIDTRSYLGAEPPMDTLQEMAWEDNNARSLGLFND